MKLNKDRDVLMNFSAYAPVKQDLSLGDHIGWHDRSTLSLTKKELPPSDFLSVYMVYEAEEIVKEYNRAQHEEYDGWFAFPEDLYVTFASAWEQDND